MLIMVHFDNVRSSAWETAKVTTDLDGITVGARMGLHISSAFIDFDFISVYDICALEADNTRLEI